MIYHGFETIIGLSVTASVMIAIILVLKAILRLKWGNIKKSAFVFMWLLVFVRLIVPFNIDVQFQNLPVVYPAQTVYQTIIPAGINAYQDTDGVINEEIYSQKLLKTQGEINANIGASRPLINTNVLICLWLLVGIGRALWIVMGYFQTMRRVKKLEDIPYEKLEMLKDKVGIEKKISLKLGEMEGPAVYGIFSSVIVVSKGSMATIDEILLHELVHVKSKDNLKKIFCELVLCVHWFNPLIWLADRELHRDIELSCDEKVIDIMGYENRSVYANAILNFAVKGKGSCSNNFASFSKNPVLGRIKNIVKLKSNSIKTPVVFMAVVLFILTGAMSGPIGNMSNQLLSYALEPSFINVKLTETEQENVIDYAVGGDFLYYMIANTSQEGALLPGYEVGVYNQKTQKRQSLVSGEETTVQDSFHYTQGNIYYVVKWTDQVGNWTSIVEYNILSKETSTIWGGHEPGLQDVRISGNQTHLAWHKILAPKGVFKEDTLIIWDIQKGKIIKKLTANGNQNYLNILDGYVTYQRENPYAGETELVRYEIEKREELAVKNLLGTQPHAAYGNQEFIVYKEDYKPSAKIVVYNANRGKNYNLWDSVRSNLTGKSTVTIQKLQKYEEGVWGINLIKNKLLLTGESNEILEIDLHDFQITEIQSKDNLNGGFYRTKIGEDMALSMQYDYDDSGELINRLFSGKLIGQ